MQQFYFRTSQANSILEPYKKTLEWCSGGRKLPHDFKTTAPARASALQPSWEGYEEGSHHQL